MRRSRPATVLRLSPRPGLALVALLALFALLVGPAHVRPPDQPAADDPSLPFYLSGGTPPGPFLTTAFDYDEYRGVRGGVTAAQIATEKRDLLGVGYPSAD